MIRIFRLKWVLLFIFLLELLVIAFVITATRTQPRSLPNMQRYTAGQHFDIRACEVYTTIPYRHTAGVSGEEGYCTVNKFSVNPGLRAVQLSLAGDTIMTATVWLSQDYTVVDFMNTYGRPVAFKQWRHAFQITWPTVILSVSHLDGGDVDNVKINYIYLH